MGKDKKGNFHPAKGKPSGQIKENDHLREDIGDAHIMHPNRNVNKDDSGHIERQSGASYKGKLNKHQKSTQATIVAEEIIGPVTKEMILSLSGYHSDNCISIYFPTHKAGKEINEKMEATVFKTLLQNAAVELKKKGIARTKIDKLFSPADELLRDDRFWTTLTGGLAVFIADGLFRYLKIPAPVHKKIIVNHAFQIGPLIPFIKGQYMILNLTADDAILYRADEFEIEPVLTTELKREVIAVGEVKDGFGEDGKDDIGGKWSIEERPLAIYYKEIDLIIRQKTGDYDNMPLVLAGKKHLAAIYREVSSYPLVWPEEIKGEVFNNTAESIHQQSLKVMADYFKVPVEEALYAYADNSANGLTSSIPEDVIKAAYEGRISQLFIEREAEMNGVFSEEKFEAEIHNEKQEQDEDLIEKIILKTILTDGDVHILSKEEMPSESAVAALMRF